jgi:hypothetical protein
MYSTRHFWRILIIVLIIYVLVDSIGPGNLKRNAPAVLRRIELTVKNTGNRAGKLVTDTVRDLQNRFSGTR